MSRANLAALSAGALLAAPGPALAGMPSVMVIVNDMARMRIQAISFFVMGLLVSAGMIQFLWNLLRRDFTSWPRLTYPKALGLVVLWGLLFVLVLTMISGARELMTPGAWEANGKTYKLAEKPAVVAPAVSLDESRRRKLEALRDALWDYGQLA